MNCPIPDEIMKIVVSYLRKSGQTVVISEGSFVLVKGIPNVIENRAFSIVLARVIGRDSSNQSNMVMLDRGSADVERFTRLLIDAFARLS